MTFLDFFETKTAKTIFFVCIFCQIFSAQIYSQTKTGKTPPTKNASVSVSPKITQVDSAKLKTILQGKGKPLLVNFWATWCDPCREEFPDLVKIDAGYKNKIDFITVSLDDVEELNTGVPKFLSEMKAQMPAYLLTTQDEDALISFVSKDWQGGLPFTILYNAGGKVAYTRMGKVKIDVLRAEIEKILLPAPAENTVK
jgi:thiol-disulfide isomerase/thioredoxin